MCVACRVWQAGSLVEPPGEGEGEGEERNDSEEDKSC